MPNHYHLVIELTEEDTLSRGVRWLDGRYAQRLNWRHSRVGHVYQGRFRAILIEKETHALEVLRYVVLNPVRAKVLERPEEYPWSSHRAVLGLDPAPAWLSVDRVLSQFGLETVLAREYYRRFVEEGIGSTKSPWDDLIGQMYLGSDEWLKKIQAYIDVKPRSSEHPVAQRIVARPDMPTILSAVANAFAIQPEAIRWDRGGVPRMTAAWLGWQEGGLRRAQIAAALRIRSEGRITQLVGECESQLARDTNLRRKIDDCLTTLRRKTND